MFIEKIIKKIKKVIELKVFYIILILLFSLIYMSPFLFGYIYGDDTVFHLMNIDLYSNTSIFSKIIPLYVNNMGWGVGIFYPCLPHIFGALILRIINNFGFTSILALKFVKFVITFLSGLFMYLLSLKIYKNEKLSIFSSLFYISSSYFFVDTYMRDALNESAIFVFIPLVFLGVYYLLNEQNNKKFYICFISGYVGMIYCHLLITMWFTFLIAIFLLFYLKKILTFKIIKPFILSIVIVVGLTGTFIFPLLEHMVNGNWFIPAYKHVWCLPIYGYFVGDYYKTSTNGLLFIRFPSYVIVLTIIGVFNLIFGRKKYKYDRRFLSGILVFSIISMFLSSQSIFWNNAPKFFNTIQFAWRIVVFSTFGICLFSVSGFESVYNIFKDKYRYILTIFMMCLIAAFTFNNMSLVRINNNIDYGEYVYKNFSKYSNRDYLPNKFIENIDYVASLKDDDLHIDGNASVKILRNETSYFVFKISDIENDINIEIPRLYYLGYTVTDSNNNVIGYTESSNGLIQVNIKKNGVYKLKYTGTFWYKFALIYKFIIVVILILKISSKRIFINRKD